MWSGSKLLIWGGNGASGALNDGAAYDPSTDTWTLLAATTLSGRIPAYAFSTTTTSELLIWGSAGETSTLNDGALYRPLKDSWAPFPSWPLAPRGSVAFGWTGTQFMVFGGSDSGTFLNDGARYNPVTAAWIKLGDPPLGYVARSWFGQDVVNGGLFVVGGLTAGLATVSDGIYFDAGGTAQLVPSISDTVLASPERFFPVAWCDFVDRCWYWSGAKLISSSPFTAAAASGGAVFSVSSRTWSSMTSVGEPSPRFRASVVWTGKSGIVWGGGDSTTAFADGAIFTP